MVTSVYSGSRGNDALPVCLGRENPNRLVSLWDMVETVGIRLLVLWPKLQELWLGLDMDGEERTTPEEAKNTLGELAKLCREVKWPDLGNQTARLLSAYKQREQPDGLTDDAIKALTEDLDEALQEKMNGLCVLLLEESDTPLFKDATGSLCGGTLHQSLSISEEELNLAGRALAVGLSTAAVSHSMRSVEAALHVLAKAVPITFAGPVELQDWVNLTER